MVAHLKETAYIYIFKCYNFYFDVKCRTTFYSLLLLLITNSQPHSIAITYWCHPRQYRVHLQPKHASRCWPVRVRGTCTHSADREQQIFNCFVVSAHASLYISKCFAFGFFGCRAEFILIVAGPATIFVYHLSVRVLKRSQRTNLCEAGLAGCLSTRVHTAQ